VFRDARNITRVRKRSGRCHAAMSTYWEGRKNAHVNMNKRGKEGKNNEGERGRRSEFSNKAGREKLGERTF